MITDEQIAELRAYVDEPPCDESAIIECHTCMQNALTLALLADHARLRAFEDAVREAQVRTSKKPVLMGLSEYAGLVDQALDALDAARKGDG